MKGIVVSGEKTGQAGTLVSADLTVRPEQSVWATALEAVLADPREPQLVFQPIVDLRRAVVAGYEALARFTGPPHAAPDLWFAAADRLGVGARLEARVVQAAISARADLPPDCFLTVNVSPHLMTEPVLQGVLTSGTLSGLVLELTEHVQVDDHDRLAELLARLRAAGAIVALDDAGSGYSGLQQMALIRPELVKIDRALVDHADRDEVKLALAELLGNYASRLNAAVIAEGIERPEELEAFIRLGVPLAQGWLLGRPGPPWPELTAEQSDRIRALAHDSRKVDRLAGLLERTATVRDDDLSSAQSMFQADRGLDVVAVLDRHQRAVCLLRRQLRADDVPSDPPVLPISLRAAGSAELSAVATRAMTRPAEVRFDPVVCGDAYGAYLGIVRPERMMLRLAELKSGPRRVDGTSGGLTPVYPIPEGETS